jgi:hypothetical protein
MSCIITNYVASFFVVGLVLALAAIARARQLARRLVPVFPTPLARGANL